MESEEEEQEDGAVICLQSVPGQSVYTKSVEIQPGTLPSLDKAIKVGVMVQLDDGTSGQRHTTEGPSQSNVVALPSNVHISDLPENVTVETEWYEDENRKIMKMRLRPEANTFFTHDAIRLNFICNYTPDEEDSQYGVSDEHSASSGEVGSEYFTDEEGRPNDKSVQTDIALGELLFSDSIASVSHAEVENVAVQTYITTINDPSAGEEGEEQGPDTEDEGHMDENEAEHGHDTEKTSTGGSQEDEQEDRYCSCVEEKEKDDEEGGYSASEEETEDEEEEKEDEEEEEEKEDEEEEKEDDEAEGDVEEPPAKRTQEAQEKGRSTTSAESPQGIPLCLLRGDPPWVDPLVDTYTVMWDTNLEIAPKDVKLQFTDTIDPLPSGLKMPEKDPLQELRQSRALSSTFSVKVYDSDQSYFGSFMATSLSSHLLKRDPELFNIHIDLNTWGFPAALHERYAKSTTASVATLFDDHPSSGQILYMNDDTPSIHSIYNPTTMADAEDAMDTMSVGFIIEGGKPLSLIIPPTKPVDTLKVPEAKGEARSEPPMVSKQPSWQAEGPRSISEEYFSTAEDLQSSTHTSSEDLKESEEEIRISSSDDLKESEEEIRISSRDDLKESEEEIKISPNLPLSLVIAVNDSRPLILLLDPQDLPITIAIGTKNVPVNNASAACAIKKLGGNMFHINNIDLKETAVTNLELEKTKSDKVRCNVTVNGNVEGQTIADLGSLGSTVLLNIPLEQVKATQKQPQHPIKVQNDVNYCQIENLPLSAIEIEDSAFEIKWQKGLPVSEDISPHKTNTLFLHSVNKNESQIHPSTINEALRRIEEKNLLYPSERIKRKTGCRCKTSIINHFSHSTPLSPYRKSSKKLNCGVLTKTLLDLEQQILPLNKALDDIKYKMQALDVEDTGMILGPTYSEGSSILSGTDSGYERDISELISSVQKEGIGAKFPRIRKSSPHIQCARDPSTDLFTPCRRKPCLKTNGCSMSGYMSAAFNMPLDVDITYILPCPMEMVAATAWPHPSLCRTSSGWPPSSVTVRRMMLASVDFSSTESVTVPDSGAPPGMDCLPLQRSPGPFHYLIHEQAKSLVALQELQNEVGALLEFRDLVMETFPHLRTKMAAGTSSPSNIPIPLTGSGGGSSSGSSKWEPGVRVRRKLHHDTLSLSSSSSSRQRKVSSQQPKSGEGSGTSSTGSSAVQDSGFGTETSSSKEHSVKNPAPPPTTTSQTAASTAPVLDEAEDELWNLLDVIHRKGTKLREEVEQLQQQFHHTATVTASTTTEGMGPRRRSLGDIEEELCGRGRLKKRLMEDTGGGGGGSLQEDEEVRDLRRERDLLLDKVAEMEAETLASRARASQLQAELGTLVAAKKDLEEQLRAAVNQKSELNSRIHDLHHQFVSSRRQSPAFAPVSRRSSEDSGKKKEVTGGRRLGTLDGVVSSPSRLSRTARGVSPDPRKVAAILQEFSAVELQRHLLTTSVENQALHQRLEKTVKSQVDLVEQLEKIKDENDDLKFQLEEKSIELEGTRARVRVLERLQQKDLPPLLPPGSSTNPLVLPILALPMPEQSQQPHSSSTESAHDHEQEESSKKVVQSPKRRPSKIPLPGTKSYCAPKPPNGKSVVASNRNRGSPSLKGRTESNSNASLVGRSAGRESSWKNRSDSNSSLSGGGKSRESSVGGRNSSLSVRNNSRDSLTGGNKSRDSLSGGNKSRDSFTMGKARGSDSLIGAKKSNGDSMSSSASKTSSFSSSSKTKESFSSSLSGGRKGLHHQASICSRSGRASAQGDQNSKETGGDSGVSNEGDQQCDAYPDSLNHLTTQDASDPTEFKPQSDTNAGNAYEQQNSIYETSDMQAFPWHHSSSSEYFDSINNSGSAVVYQNNSVSSSYQQQYLQREGLAECDSLEKGDVGVELHDIMADAEQDGGNFTGKSLWTTLP